MSNPTYLLEPARLRWADNTPESDVFDDIYWHRDHAVQEKQFVFVDSVKQHLAQHPEHQQGRFQYTIAELGFGFGINCLLTAAFWSEMPSSARLNLISFEKHPVERSPLRNLLKTYNFEHTEALIAQYPLPVRGQHVIWLADNIRLLLIFDDAERGINQLDADVDHWFLDGFSPSRNPDLWQQELIKKARLLSRPGARLATYSAAGHVRRSLEANRFEVSRQQGFGNKKEMIRAMVPGDWQPAPHDADRTTIIGAGIAGHYLAEALRRRTGDFNVFDGGEPGASRIPQLTVFPQLAAEPEAKYRFSLTASQYMQNSPGYHHDGMRWIPRTSEEAERLSRIASLFPDDMVAKRSDGAFDFHLAGWLATQELFDHLSLDVEPVLVESMDHQGHWKLRDQHSKVHETVNVILATGFERRLLPPRLEVRGIRGQAVSIPAAQLTQVLNSDVTVFPPLNGNSVISGTYARSDSLEPQSEDTIELINTAKQLHEIETEDPVPWVGIRAVSRDRLPLIGPMPDWESLHDANRLSAVSAFQPGLYLCSAFASRGATHARLCAEQVVSQLYNEPRVLGHEHQLMLSPARFAFRDR